MRYLLAIATTLLCCPVFGQSIDSLQAEIDSLQGLRSDFQERAATVGRKIDSLKQDVTLLEFKSEAGDGVAITVTGGKLHTQPKPLSEVIKTFEADTTVVAVGAEGGYVRISDGRHVGYINDLYLDVPERVLSYLEEQGFPEEESPGTPIEKRRKEVEERQKTYVDNRPQIVSRYKEAILEGKIMLGMTAEMVRASWGNPGDVNRTVTQNGTREQWVYGSDPQFRRYLYFENDELTSWQDQIFRDRGKCISSGGEVVALIRQIKTNESPKETALALFELINIIVDQIMSREKRVEEVYNMPPVSKKEGIKNRNNN